VRREKELRFFCRSEPLLATYGLDHVGELFVRIKVYKQNRIFAQIVAKSGEVKIQCRNCLRWHRVVFRARVAELLNDEAPQAQVPRV
jgi:hypothetical protein